MKRLLAAVAFLPLACTKPSETPSRSDDDASSIAPDPTASSTPSSSSTAGMSPPMSAAVTSASASASASASPSSKKAACEALQQKVQTLFTTGRGCKTSTDCTNLMTTVGLDGQCGLPISKATMPDVKNVVADFRARRCLDYLPPQPTATCPIPATPTCVNGQCN